MTKAALKDLLREVYNQRGPREAPGHVVAPEKYAALSTAEIDNRWDFDDRHFMQRIAQAIARS